jgi:hypothetical protein
MKGHGSPKRMGGRQSWPWILTGIMAAFAMAAFYAKYVPLVRPFQMVLLPMTIALILVTFRNVRLGLALFVFFIPLVNSLPYFFRIREDIPHVPTALVLCLFFLLGWIWHRAVHPSPQRFYPFFRPLAFFSLLVAGSALVTIWRYANFFPFLSNRILELKANVEGTTAGGAIQSSLFFALNYLTAAAFIYIFLQVADHDLILRVLLPLLAGAVSLSLVVGFVQNFVDITWGNNLRGIEQSLVNATFKDSISFGVFLAMAAPLLVGMALTVSGGWRYFCIALLAPVSCAVLFAGSRGGLVGLVAALALSVAWVVGWSRRPASDRPVRDPWPRTVAGVLLLVLVAVLVLAFARFHLHRVSTLTRWQTLWTQSTSHFASSPRGRLWQMALAMMKEYPITGIGIGSYIIEVSNVARQHSVPIVNSQSAENHLLQVGSELGLPGILLMLWLLAEIVREVRRRRFSGLNDKRGGAVGLGALVGLFVFLINAQFHSFVGSYEIKYMAWLLLGMVLVLGNPKRIERRRRFPGWVGASVLGLIALHGVFSAWQARHDLSLERRSERFGIRQEFGFFPREKTAAGEEFRWSGGLAGAEIRTDQPVLRLPLRVAHPDIRRRPVEVRIYLAEEFFRSWKLGGRIRLENDRWHEFQQPLGGARPHKAYMLISVSRTWRPRKELGTTDDRDLGIAVAESFFRLGPSHEPAAVRQRTGI